MSRPRQERPGAASASPAVEVRRSARRSRTVTAFRDGGVLVVCIPARFTREQERVWVDRMVANLASQDARRRPSDDALARRAVELSERYLDGRAKPSSVRWVGNQLSRWGSTTTADRTIRLSDRLQGMPSWVLDYVLVHELAHLLEHGHSETFWNLVAAYPRSERARGFLEGLAAARNLPGGTIDGDVDGGIDGDVNDLVDEDLDEPVDSSADPAVSLSPRR